MPAQRRHAANADWCCMRLARRESNWRILRCVQNGKFRHRPGASVTDGGDVYGACVSFAQVERPRVISIKPMNGIIMNRRQILASIPGLWLMAALPAFSKDARVTPLNKSKADWKSILPLPNFKVLFEEDTERPGSSPLNQEKRAGTFVCAACFLPLFNSESKYDSGTGWPSFFQPLPDALGTKKDRQLIWVRTEYHCARCGGHQGHVFEDGPKPTGLRYCNNGLALRFVPKEEKLPELRT